MSRTLTTPQTFEEFCTELFETIYPHHKVTDNFSLIWHNDEYLIINWYSTTRTALLHDIWDLRQADATPPLEMIKAWVETNMLPTYEEAVDHGVPFFNVPLRSWDFGVYRAKQLVLLPSEEFQGSRREVLKKRCLTRMTSDMFRVKQKEAVVTLTSAMPLQMPHCAGLFNRTLLNELVHQVYDITESTRFLVASTPSSPVLLGHASAINRLSDGIEDSHVILDLPTLETLG